jgi:O-antigen/teichoic acid export membrane protein
LTLVPRLGIAGAGIALCGAYAVMLVVMHLLTRRAFVVAFEWRRLAHLLVVVGGIAALGDALLPTRGATGLLTRVAAFVAIPLALALTRFVDQRELDGMRTLFARAARRRAASEPV